MNVYYDSDPQIKKWVQDAGIDYNLASCLEYNPQDEFVIEDVAKVLAVIEGENDETAWHWILALKDGRFAYLTGGCDYTGWDCQSNASSIIAQSARQATGVAELPFVPKLLEQVNSGKAITWREDKDKEFGL